MTTAIMEESVVEEDIIEEWCFAPPVVTYYNVWNIDSQSWIELPYLNIIPISLSYTNAKRPLLLTRDQAQAVCNHYGPSKFEVRKIANDGVSSIPLDPPQEEVTETTESTEDKVYGPELPFTCYCCGKGCTVWQQKLPDNPEQWVEICKVCYAEVFWILFKDKCHIKNKPVFDEGVRKLLTPDWKAALDQHKKTLEKEKSQYPTAYCYVCQEKCRRWDIWQDTQKVTPEIQVCSLHYFQVYKLRYAHRTISLFEGGHGAGLTNDWKPYLEQLKHEHKQPDYFQALKNLEEAVGWVLLEGENKDMQAGILAVKNLRRKYQLAFLARTMQEATNCGSEFCLFQHRVNQLL